MTLAGGMLYVAHGSFADTDPYHGWVIGYNATNLQQSANYAFTTTPNATVAVAYGANAGGGRALGWVATGCVLTLATNCILRPLMEALAPIRTAVATIPTASSS